MSDNKDNSPPLPKSLGFRVGDKVTCPNLPDNGIGAIIEIDGYDIICVFPDAKFQPLGYGIYYSDELECTEKGADGER